MKHYRLIWSIGLVLKAKKGKGTVELLDEDDPELLEAEMQKQAEETLLNKAKESAPSTDNAAFDTLYEALLAETKDPKDMHVIPKHSRLNNLIHHTTTAEQVEQLPVLVEQWRNKLLPVTPYTSSNLIDVCCRTNRGDVAYTLLGERQRYGLLPTKTDFEKTIATLATNDLDKAFITLAMVPLYAHTRTGAMYNSLLEGCLANAEEDSLEKAVLTAEELVSSQEIENKVDAKSALDKLANTLLENGQEDKAKPVQEFLSTL